MQSKENNRILAREVANVRELSFEELQLVAGGGHSTGGAMCDSGWQNTMYLMCVDCSYYQPCDQTVEAYD
jgi:hypothetical protein